MTANEYIQGYAPKVETTAGNPEAQKYGRMWAQPQYRNYSPGEEWAKVFLKHANPRPGAEVIDFGCGTGRGGRAIASMGGMRVIFVDFVRNSLDEGVKKAIEETPDRLRFVKADLERSIPVAAEYGYCTDVMEHIPPNKVDIVLNNILRSAQHVFFSICNVDDVLGGIIGERLHLTIEPFAWWKKKFEERDCKIHYSEDVGGMTSIFYVSAWQTGQDLVDSGKLNTEEEQICANVRHNCAQGWQQISPHEENNLEVMLIGGSPALDSHLDEIKKNRADGVKLITMNGSYNWALENGLKPSAQIVVDARPFNARFAKPVIDDCKYLVASQCDPSVFEGLPKERTYIWHTTTELIKPILDENYEKWWAVPGGSTVLLRAIPMMRMLGYRKFILYGCASCLGYEGQHHAYEQKENDSPLDFAVVVNPGGRTFRCHPWMASQATEFIDLIKVLGDEIELDVKGDGLLSHILEVGANEANIVEQKNGGI